MAFTDTLNAKVPVDVKSITRRRKRENFISISEPKNRWNRFKVKFSSSVTCLGICDKSVTTGSILAIGGATRIDLHEIGGVSAKDVRQKRDIISSKTYTRFKNLVRSLGIRNDGNLICAGDDTGLVQIFDVASRTQLRRVKGHTGPVQGVAFASNNPSFVLSGGDDTSLRLWDITDGNCILNISEAHTDSIRCVVPDPKTTRNDKELVFASGGNDGYVKIWRFFFILEEINYENNLKLLHGDNVEAIAYFPDSNLLITGGGLDIKIWDIMAGGGKLVHCFQAHSKSVTSLTVSQDGSYIVSGSLDQTIKIFCSSKFTILQSITVDEAVSGIQIWKNPEKQDLLAISLVDGQWFIRQRITNRLDTSNTGDSIKRLKQSVKEAHKSRYISETSVPNDAIVIDTFTTSKRFSWLDRLVQGFNYQKSLDYAVTRSAATTLALLDALIERGMLQIACRGKNETNIIPSLLFINREFGKDSCYTSLLLEFANCLLVENQWLYITTDKQVLQAIQKISSKLDIDISQHQILRELIGLIELVWA